MDTTAQTRQSIGMLMDSRMAIYYSGEKSRIDFKMGKMYTTSVRINRPENKAISLTESMMGNYAIPLDIAALDFANAAQLDTTTEVILKDEEKTILGFNCKKVLVIVNGKITSYWYTDEIKVEMKGQTLVNPFVPGFPLSFSAIENGILMTFEASNYSFELEDENKIFSTEIPEGYQIMPSDQQAPQR